MKPTIYLYNLRNETGAKIEALCAKECISCQHVTPELYGERIGYVTGIEGFTATGNVVDCTQLSDEMLLFKNFDQESLTNFLAQYRQAGIKTIPLKAGLTPTNIHWTSVELHAELHEEHQAFLNTQKQ